MAREAVGPGAGRSAEPDDVRYALRPGDRLRSERELAERLGVSRTSVRQAPTALEVTGLVDIRHGGGVFPARAPHDVLPSLATELAGTYEQLPAVIEVREAIERKRRGWPHVAEPATT